MRAHAETPQQFLGRSTSRFARLIALASLAIAGVFLTEAGMGQSPPSVAAGAPTMTGAPIDSPQGGTGASQANGSSSAPNVLDGLESLKLAKDPDLGPPIVEAGELFQGQPYTGATAPGGADAAFMRPLEANLDTPTLNAPALQGALEAAPLVSPNDKPPVLEVPNIFGPTMTGSPLEVLNAAGPSLQNRPLGTIGAPSFLSKTHSVAVGSGRVRYGVSVNASAAYNNNVTASSTNPQGDMIFTLQPTFYLETGKKGTVQFLWAPSFLEYSKFKQFNSLNQTFLFTSRYRWTKLRVGLDASYIAQSGLFLNSQGQAQQKAVYAKMFAGYSLTKKTEVSLDFSGTGTSSSSGGNQFQGTLTTSVDYKFSRKTTIGAALALSYSSFSGGMSTSESFLLRLLYNPTSKLVFRGEGGLQFRQSSSTGAGSYSAATTVVNLSLTYNPTLKTYVSMRFFRNVDMDGFSAGTQQITTGAESSASWRISRAASFQGGLAAGRVENVATNGQSAGTYNYVQANMALSYLLNNDINLSLFDNLQQRMGGTQGGNYMSNMSGMSLGMGF
jgi:hypothetical protein